MLKSLICLLTFSLAQGAENPFWKAKPKAYERVNNGEVLVSVNSQEMDSEPRHELRVNGAGQVSVPCDFAFEAAQKYEEVAKQAGYLSSFQAEADGKTMEIGLRAYGFSTRFKLSVVPDAASTPRGLDFKMLSGPMSGFAWRLAFDPVRPAKCEIGISGNYRYEKFPIAKIFLEFGLEVVFQRMAISLRSYLEESYQKHLDKKSKPVKEFAPK